VDTSASRPFSEKAEVPPEGFLWRCVDHNARAWVLFLKAPVRYLYPASASPDKRRVHRRQIYKRFRGVAHNRRDIADMKALQFAG
jgi:hypothetical protein